MKFKKLVVKTTFGLTALALASTTSAFNENLEFNGVISNTSLQWEWEIDSDAITSAQDIILERIGATSNGSNLEWKIPKFDNQLILKGYLPGVLTAGVIGMEPTVIFNGIDVTGATDDNSIGIDIDVDGNNSEQGILTLDITGNGNIKYTEPKADNIFTASLLGGNTAVGTWAKTRVEETNPTLGSSVTAVEVPYSDFWVLLKQPGLSYLTAATGFASQTAKLSFPSTQAPSTWLATLPITIIIN